MAGINLEAKFNTQKATLKASELLQWSEKKLNYWYFTLKTTTNLTIGKSMAIEIAIIFTHILTVLSTND